MRAHHIPISGFYANVRAALGHGRRAHSPNEYFVIQGVDARHGHIYGLAGVEKSIATILYNYAGKNKGYTN